MDLNFYEGVVKMSEISEVSSSKLGEYSSATITVKLIDPSGQIIPNCI